MQVRPKADGDQAWVSAILGQLWGSPQILAGGKVFDAANLPALIAGERDGLATFAIAPDRASARLVTLNALTPRQGVGTALIEALAAQLATDGIPLLRVSTTNDNIDALRFYQRRDFRIATVHADAIDRARQRKPSIPLTGHYGIAIHDEFELIREVGQRVGTGLSPL